MPTATLTNDGRWTLTWNGESRLISIESLPATPSASWQKLLFEYDSQGRRISKVVSNWNGTAWVFGYQRRFVYDAWNLVAELDESNVLVNSFAWGLDLSGTMQGAGGVGGLLALSASTDGVHFVGFDGNGNVIALASADTGNVSAAYEYDPFGRLGRVTGTIGARNPFCFSTKYQDRETGLLYYGYRYYDPQTGRWPSRDPIGEKAFLWQFLKLRAKTDLKRFVQQSLGPAYGSSHNDDINYYDYLGLAEDSGGCSASESRRDKCYQYACNNYGKYSDVPGARGKKACDRRYDCDEIRNAAKADGLIDVPGVGCPDGYHKVAYAVQDNGNDYHWFRSSEDGKSWCHKFFWYDKPSNLDGSGKVITDPSSANLNFPQQGRQPAANYKHCKDGYLCAPNVWTPAK